MTRRRVVFESWHKRAGYLAFALVLPTIWLGAGLIGAPWWVQALPVLSVAAFSAAFVRLTRLGRRVDTWTAIWGSSVPPGPTSSKARQ